MFDPKKKYTVVYDFDPVLFASSTIPEEPYIMVKLKGSDWSKEFKNITEFKGRTRKIITGWLGKRNDLRIAQGKEPMALSDFEIEWHTRTRIDSRTGKPMTLRVPTANMKRKINQILEQDWCGDLRLVIGGEGNYRNDVSFSVPYKNSRKEKTQWFLDCKEWLLKNHSDKVIMRDGIEADDVLGWFGWQSFRKAQAVGDLSLCDVILVHIDKDIDQVPALHFWTDDIEVDPWWISERDAYSLFWKQMLTGDDTDCIPGVSGLNVATKKRFGLKTRSIGAKTAEKILADCKTEREMAETVLWCYASWYRENPISVGQEDGTTKTFTWESVCEEQFILLRMMEEEMVIPKLTDTMERLGITFDEINDQFEEE